MNNALLEILDNKRGRAAVFASVNDASRIDILKSAHDFRLEPVDICEWRIDCFDKCDDAEAVIGILSELKAVLSDMPILATVRTEAEGGCRNMERDTYIELLTAVIKSGLADGIDIELFTAGDAADTLVESARINGMAAIISNHDFKATPPAAELEARLLRMGELGADIAKLAVMPACEEDVDSLLAVTRKVAADRPELYILTIAMGELGIRSRTDGWRYGSCGTFGSIGRASAPGQLEVRELAGFL